MTKKPVWTHIEDVQPNSSEDILIADLIRQARASQYLAWLIIAAFAVGSGVGIAVGVVFF